MHVLFLSDNFSPEVNAPASRTHEHCRQWVAAGEQVTVITCVPNFPGGRIFNGYRNRLWQTEEVDGIRVIRVWSYITANDGFVKRILDYMSYMVMAFIASLFVRKVDVVVATSPQFFTAEAGWAVSAVKRIPFVFELRDIWPESIKTVGAMQHPKAIRFLEGLEMFLYRRADLIVAVTHAFKATLVRRGIDGDKIEVITNGVDLSRFSPRPKDQALLRELRLEGQFIAGYVGTHGLAHGLETLLQAMQLLQQGPPGPSTSLLLLGDGARKAELKRLAQEMGLQHVLFIDTVSKDQVARYWSVLDVSIIHLRQTELFTTVIPSKLFECMGMGLPVLHGVAGESADIVTLEDVGLPFPPEDAQALAAGITRLRTDVALRSRYAANAVAAAKNYDRTTLALRMLHSLRRLAQAS